MTGEQLAIVVAIGAAVVAVAVVSQRVTALLRVPAAAVFLIVAAAVAAFVPHHLLPSHAVDESVVSIALAIILFDGGMHIGWRRFRRSAGPITWLGIAGTFVTAAGLALAAHYLLGFDWQASLLLGAALSPTDPAVVFSVLGGREIEGRSSTILEGESGANDPVGIALMVSLLAGGVGSGAVGTGILTFLLQLGVGAAVGILGGLGLRGLAERVTMPTAVLSAVFVVACALMLYGIGAALQGSGFLAVFIAGILVGDVRAPHRGHVEAFAGGLAGLAEIVVFVLLGLSVDVRTALDPSVLLPGLVLAVLLMVVLRPVLVGAISLPIRLSWGERAFVLAAGLKGAVPILLGLFILEGGVPGGSRLYGIVFVVVIVSVLVQGGLVPLMLRWFRVPTR